MMAANDGSGRTFNSQQNYRCILILHLHVHNNLFYIVRFSNIKRLKMIFIDLMMAAARFPEYTFPFWQCVDVDTKLAYDLYIATQ